MEQSSWPACVGLSKIGKYGRVHTLWNDRKGSRPTPVEIDNQKSIEWKRNEWFFIMEHQKIFRQIYF